MLRAITLSWISEVPPSIELPLERNQVRGTAPGLRVRREGRARLPGAPMRHRRLYRRAGPDHAADESTEPV